VSPDGPSGSRSPEVAQFFAAADLIDALEAAVASKDLRRQSQVMRRVTDLFLANDSLSKANPAALFEDVMTRLLGVVDARIRAEFGARLATVPNAPAGTLRLLALDEAIEVAGPVLEQAEGLPEATLLETAQTKSQRHLLAISRRRRVPMAVTDVLVDRGDDEVVRTAAGNAGARFSDAGAASLSARAANDPELACRLWSRADLPRERLLCLVEGATRDVIAKLVETDGSKAGLFRDLVAEAANRVREAVRQNSGQFAAALACVEDLNRAGKLDETRLKLFADENSFDAVLVALSLKCDLPIALVERALADKRLDQLLVFAKAAELSWDTMRAILLMLKLGDINIQRDLFARLQSKTAKTALQYYRLRSRAVQAAP
jgi:uncharacterized protein (DUF2336 family)